MKYPKTLDIDIGLSVGVGLVGFIKYYDWVKRLEYGPETTEPMLVLAIAAFVIWLPIAIVTKIYFNRPPHHISIGAMVWLLAVVLGGLYVTQDESQTRQEALEQSWQQEKQILEDKIEKDLGRDLKNYGSE